MNKFYAFLAVVVVVAGILFGINMVQNHDSTSRETNLNITTPQSVPEAPTSTPAVQTPAASAPVDDAQTSDHQ